MPRTGEFIQTNIRQPGHRTEVNAFRISGYSPPFSDIRPGAKSYMDDSIPRRMRICFPFRRAATAQVGAAAAEGSDMGVVETRAGGAELSLDDVLRDGLLHCVYQPFVDVDSGAVLAFEALLR